jgi:DNA-directed RNA polymerase specialized sigma24 family protein
MQALSEYVQRSDEELGALVARGDLDALGALYDRHVVDLHDYVAGTLGDTDTAHDVVRVTFVKAWDGLAVRRVKVRNLRGWLFAIARSAALDELRKVHQTAGGATDVDEPAAVDTTRPADPTVAALASDIRERIWINVEHDIAGLAAGASGGQPPTARRLPSSRVLRVAGALAAVGFVAGLVAAVTTGGGTGQARPDDVRSVSHVTGRPSQRDQVEMTWAEESHATGYSVRWDHASTGVPDTVSDLPGDATGVTSPLLDSGTWWFHLRTRGKDGRWTTAVHLGPFTIGVTGTTGQQDGAPSAGSGGTATPGTGTSTGSDASTTATPSPNAAGGGSTTDPDASTTATTGSSTATPPTTVASDTPTPAEPTPEPPPTTPPRTAPPPPPTTVPPTTAPPPPPPPETGTGDLFGAVTDGQAGKVLPGALVIVEGSQPVAIVVADDTGLYRVPGLAAGTYVVTVSFDGYVNQTRDITVAAGQLLTEDFALLPIGEVVPPPPPPPA